MDTQKAVEINHIEVDFEEIKPIKKDPIVERVKRKYDYRSQIGIQKYNTTLTDNKAEILEWINHLQEELMDATLYLEKIKDKL